MTQLVVGQPPLIPDALGVGVGPYQDLQPVRVGLGLQVIEGSSPGVVQLLLDLGNLGLDLLYLVG